MDCSSGDYYFSFLLDEKRKKRIKKKRSFNALLKFTVSFPENWVSSLRHYPAHVGISNTPVPAHRFFWPTRGWLLHKLWSMKYEWCMIFGLNWDVSSGDSRQCIYANLINITCPYRTQNCSWIFTQGVAQGWIKYGFQPKYHPFLLF